MYPYFEELRKAVSYFWKIRAQQGENQGSNSGKKDAGNRTQVTGGAQLNGFIDLFSQIASDNGLTNSEIITKETTLPGYFRPTKEWDLLLISNKELVATIEFKSHVGPSFGNNFNNRVEEALGTATDILTAFKYGILGKQQKPWMGYFLLLESTLKSNQPVKNKEIHFKVDKIFEQASYAQRYNEFCRRLIREQLYDAACLLLSNQETGLTGDFKETDTDIDAHTFITSLVSKIQSHIQRIKFKK